MIVTLAFGTTTVPTGMSINAPHDPSLSVWFLVSRIYVIGQEKESSEPNNSNIAGDTFSYFTHEEIHVWTAHANAYNRYGCTLEAASDSQESAF